VNGTSVVSCSVLVVGCAQKPIIGSESHHCSDLIEVWSAQWLCIPRGIKGLSPTSRGASGHSGIPLPRTSDTLPTGNDNILKILITSESIQGTVPL
jgi:hypothetical protein